MAGFDVDAVVQIFEGNDALGSGYHLGNGRVLTARHVIERRDEHGRVVGERAQVLARREREPEQGRPLEVAWRGAGAVDVVVLRPVGEDGPALPPSVWIFDGSPLGREWFARGFPAAFGSSAEPVEGKVARAQGEHATELRLLVEAPPSEAKDWKGLSGAAVFVGDRMFGVISAVSKVSKGSRLEVTSIVGLLMTEETLREAVGLRPRDQRGPERLGNAPSAGEEPSRPRNEPEDRGIGSVDNRGAVIHQQVIVVGTMTTGDMKVEARSDGGGARERLGLASPAVLPALQGGVGSMPNTRRPSEIELIDALAKACDSGMAEVDTKQPSPGEGPRSAWERRLVEIIARKIDAEDGLLVWLGQNSRWSAAAKLGSTKVAEALLAEGERPVSLIRGFRELMTALIGSGANATKWARAMNAVLFLALPVVAGRGRLPHRRADGRAWSIAADYPVTAETGMAHLDERPMELTEWRPGVAPTPRAYITSETPESGARLAARVRDMKRDIESRQPDLIVELARGILKASNATIREEPRDRTIGRAKLRVNDTLSRVDPKRVLTYYTILLGESDRELAEVLARELAQHHLGELRVLVPHMQDDQRDEDDAIDHELDELRKVHAVFEESKP